MSSNDSSRFAEHLRLVSAHTFAKTLNRCERAFLMRQMQDLKRILSSARDEEKIQRIIGFHLRQQGLDSNWLGGLKFTDRTGDPPAFGGGLLFAKVPIGLVFVSESFCNALSQEELEFVVLHELGHIVKSHSIANFIVALGKEFVTDLLASNLELPREQALGIIALLKWFFPGARIEEGITAQKELQADEYAVTLQRKKEPAISVLQKLARENIRAPSHVTVTGAFVLPAITFEQRIDAIRNLPV